VLAQLVSDAGYALLAASDTAVHAHCVRQFNLLLARVRLLEPELTEGFTPLAEGSGPGSVRMRGRDLLVQLSTTRSADWLSEWFDRLFAPGERHACNSL
jgi:hypothetical protein